MFFPNNDYGATKPARRKAATRNTITHPDQQVRAQVEREFSVMDQEHARIRTEALAAHVRDNGEPDLIAKGKTA
jgi:hypothetical protein